MISQLGDKRAVEEMKQDLQNKQVDSQNKKKRQLDFQEEALAAANKDPNPSFVKQSNALDSWKIILLQDTDAPFVMLDSILPMVGLEAVKKSLIDMYHRFKLHGSASSYNGKCAATIYYLVHFLL